MLVHRITAAVPCCLALLLTVAVPPALGGVCGDPAAGDCSINNGSPGCDDLACCETVCAFDSFCCDTTWDDVCASLAEELCYICGHPSAGSCYVENGTTGCNDGDCCTFICSIDPFCCNMVWDPICVDNAQLLCAGCGTPGAGSCNVNNGTPGCSVFLCCTQVCDLDPFCCETTWDQLCADMVATTCCAGDTNGDDVVDVNDLTLVILQWGPCAVLPCEADLDGNAVVNVDDLTILILGWGPCP